MKYYSDLYHSGVLCMKWGVRRASKKYQKLINKAKSNIYSKSNSRYINAYNKTADEYNNGKIEAFNKKNNSKSSKYIEKYNKAFEKDFNKNYNKMLFDDITKDKNYIKAEQVSKKYGLESVDKFVQGQHQTIKDLQKLF